MSSTDGIGPNDQKHSIIHSLNEELSQLEMDLANKSDAPGKQTTRPFLTLLTYPSHPDLVRFLRPATPSLIQFVRYYRLPELHYIAPATLRGLQTTHFLGRQSCE
jgi:hypothetical protein